MAPEPVSGAGGASPITPVHLGVDLSRWNTISELRDTFAALRDLGKGAEPFVFWNCLTPDLLKKHNEARGAGFRATGVYRFVTDPQLEPIQSQMVKACRALGDDPVPVACDYEDTYGDTFDEISGRLQAASEIVRAFRRAWVCYLDAWFLEALPSFPRPLWLADPGAAFPVEECLIWQRGAVTTVPGLDGPTDIDEWMDNDVRFHRFFGLHLW